MKLASIRLTTRDVPALTKFYEKLTGIAPSSHPSFPGYAEIRVPGFTIALAGALHVVLDSTSDAAIATRHNS
jgi:hypothetical protein